jgi:hypothetical protein
MECGAQADDDVARARLMKVRFFSTLARSRGLDPSGFTLGIARSVGRARRRHELALASCLLDASSTPTRRESRTLSHLIWCSLASNSYSESGMRRVLGEVDVGATGNDDDRNG